MSAYGLAEPSTSLSPLKIWTGVTSLKSNIKGVPSSVNDQMKTIVPPAKRPGRMSGSVILVNRRHGPEPRFSAASLIAGSMLARAAVAFR